MSAAAAAILEGMPEPRTCACSTRGGVTVIIAGPVVLFRFAADDTAMRNIAVAVLRQLGFPGQEVAAVLGLTANYVATLHQRALRDGTAALVRPAGRPRGDREAAWEQARAVAGRRGAGRGDRAAAGGEPVHGAAAAGPGARAGPAAGRRCGAGLDTRAGGRGPGRTRSRAAPEPGEPARARAGPVPPGAGAAWRAAGSGPRSAATVRSRYAGAMLLHAFAARAGAGDDLAGRGRADAAPRTWRCCRRSACASRSARPRPSSSSTWPRPRPGRWPGWRRCRGCGRCGPGWPRSPTATDPLELQADVRRPRCWPPTR